MTSYDAIETREHADELTSADVPRLVSPKPVLTTVAKQAEISPTEKCAGIYCRSTPCPSTTHAAVTITHQTREDNSVKISEQSRVTQNSYNLLSGDSCSGASDVVAPDFEVITAFPNVVFHHYTLMVILI